MLKCTRNNSRELHFAGTIDGDKHTAGVQLTESGICISQSPVGLITPLTVEQARRFASKMLQLIETAET